MERLTDIETTLSSLRGTNIWHALLLLVQCGKLNFCSTHPKTNVPDINGLVQESRNSIALAMELRLSCTKTSIHSIQNYSSRPIFYSPSSKCIGERARVNFSHCSDSKVVTVKTFCSSHHTIEMYWNWQFLCTQCQSLDTRPTHWPIFQHLHMKAQRPWMQIQDQSILTYHIEAWTKWWTFCRLHFPLYFLECHFYHFH